MGGYTCLGILGGFLAIGVTLVLILVPISFKGVEYYELAFKQSKSTGMLYRDRIYTMGRYCIGPDKKFFVMPSTILVEYNSIDIFDKEKVSIGVYYSFQYILNENRVSDLLKFGMDYKRIISKKAASELKNIGTRYFLNEYILKRKEIEQFFHKTLKTALRDVSCKVLYFQLLVIQHPNARAKKKIQSLVLPQQNEAEKVKQRAKDIRLETELQVESYDNDGKVLHANARAQKKLLDTNAQTKAKAIVDKARFNSLKNFYEQVGLTEPKDKIAFDYLRSLQNSNKTRLKINFDQLIGVVGNKLSV